MSDIIDKANDTAEVFLQADLKNAAAAPVQQGVGFCINCGVPVEGEKRWCDVECRDDWTSAQRGR